jgi:hypothetical protein
MLVSFCPGRIRLRFKELKNKAVADQACAAITAQPGILGAQVNALTGSLLIEYDPSALSPETLVALGRRELARLNIKLDIPDLP